MARVLLVAANREQFPEPVFPLGAAYVAGALEAHGHDVRLFDAGLARRPLPALRRAVAEHAPDVVGLSLRNVDNAAYPHTRSYIGWYEELAGAARSAVPARSLVVGGSAFAIFPHELLRLLDADIGVTGDGEAGMLAAVTAASVGATSPRRAARPGLVASRLDDLSGVRLPTELGRVFPSFRRYGTIGVQTARGCPHHCLYCTYPLLEGHLLRRRPPETVAEEIAALQAQHPRAEFFIVDSAFNADEEHLAAVCRAIVARRLKLRFSCYLQPVMRDPALFGLLAEAGCVAVDFGTDSASDAVLARLGKSFTVEELRAASAACRRAGIDFCHSLLFGGPGETPETVDETVRVMDEIAPKAVVAMVAVRIYPGTELARAASDRGAGTDRTAMAEAATDGRSTDGTPADGRPTDGAATDRATAEGAMRQLLAPRFYVADGDPGWPYSQVRPAAAARRSWFLPGSRDWSALLGPKVLRLLHGEGPLWRSFPRPRWYRYF
jgi:radical SAM superfamily enzyme YgiQ (UPF0313 family)